MLETKKSPVVRLGFLLVAERTGLEPATPGVTGRASHIYEVHLIGYCL